MGFWPTVSCHGPAAECGFSYGTQAGELIKENIRLYEQLFRQRHGAGWREVRRWAAQFVPRLERFAPDLLQEMQGIAAGAGVDLLDIMALNARFSFQGARGSDGCTSLACLPAPGGAGTTLVAQNWDNMAGLRAIVLRINRPGEPEILTLTEAGMLAKIGLNSRGIALCVNGLFDWDEPGEGIPIFCLMRKALRMSNIAEAIAAVVGTERDAPHNYLFGSSSGEAYMVEALCRVHDVLAPAGRDLVHTNHILSPKLNACVQTTSTYPNSSTRLRRAQARLAAMEGHPTVEAIKELLGDHQNAPKAAICRHDEATDDGTRIRTKCAIIMEPAYGRMQISAGNPCQSTWETFTLGEGV
ncbi:MAG: C45 family autoproteolytic acyltransferase/hydrolase [Bacteroidota bacterium]